MNKRNSISSQLLKRSSSELQYNNNSNNENIQSKSKLSTYEYNNNNGIYNITSSSNSNNNKGKVIIIDETDIIDPIVLAQQQIKPILNTILPILDFTLKYKILINIEDTNENDILINTLLKQCNSYYNNINEYNYYFSTYHNSMLSNSMYLFNSLFTNSVKSSINLNMNKLLYYYTYPPEDINNSFDKSKLLYIPNNKKEKNDWSIFLSHRWTIWEESFTSLHHSFIYSQMPYYYYITKSFSFLFLRVPDTHSPNMSKFLAIGYQTSSNLRELLKTNGIKFAQPYEANVTTSSVYVMTAVTPLESAKIEVENRKKDLTEYERDFESLVIIEDTESNNSNSQELNLNMLFNFLLTYRLEEPPLLVSHSPFLRAGLNKLAVNKLNNGSIEVTGLVLPLSSYLLQELLKDQFKNFKINSQCWSSQLGFNLGIAMRHTFAFGEFIKLHWSKLFNNDYKDRKFPMQNLFYNNLQKTEENFFYNNN